MSTLLSQVRDSAAKRTAICRRLDAAGREFLAGLRELRALGDANLRRISGTVQDRLPNVPIYPEGLEHSFQLKEQVASQRGNSESAMLRGRAKQMADEAARFDCQAINRTTVLFLAHLLATFESPAHIATLGPGYSFNLERDTFDFEAAADDQAQDVDYHLRQAESRLPT